MYIYICKFCGPPWALMGPPWAIVGPPGPLWAPQRFRVGPHWALAGVPGPLWAPLGPCGHPWAFVGPWALVGVWALVDRAIVGPSCALVGPLGLA